MDIIGPSKQQTNRCKKMETILKIKEILNTITNRHLALINQDGGPYNYKIVEYVRTSKGIESVQCKMGGLELMLDYAEHLVNG